MNKAKQIFTVAGLLVCMLPAATSASSATRSGTEDLATMALGSGNLTAAARAQLLLSRGRAWLQVGRYNDALSDLNAALEAKALTSLDTADAHFYRGVALDQLGRVDEAIAEYSAALQDNPKLVAALGNRGNAYRRAGKIDEARRDYNAALAQANTRPEFAEYGLGQIALADGDKDAARDWFAKALAANPQYKPAAQSLAALPKRTRAARTKPVAPAAAMMPTAPPADPARSPPPSIVPAAFEPPDTLNLRPAIVEALDDGPELRLRKSGGSDTVQLGAWRAEAAAAIGWNAAMAHAPDLLKGLRPEIVVADIPGKGRYWRLRTTLPDADTARELCRRLQATGLACLAVK